MSVSVIVCVPAQMAAEMKVKIKDGDEKIICGCGAEMWISHSQRLVELVNPGIKKMCLHCLAKDPEFLADPEKKFVAV